MSTDRLAQIEAVARTTKKAWGTNAYAADVLALVEVAKAARAHAEYGPLEDTIRWNHMESGERATLIRLRAALARLGSGAAEEDA